MKKYLQYVLLCVMLALHTILFAQDRFPRPEFETGYVYPEHQTPLQRAPIWDYIDVAVLIAALSLTSWLAIKKRSRQGLIWISLFSLAYFGFIRQGCICSVGSVQNVSLALFNEGYTIPLSALLFFLLPLLFALAYGRVFCAGVCPLGAIQELTGIRPLKLPKPIEIILTSIPFIYLAIAVISASTNSQFLICRYDPFVGIFRLDAPATMIIFGVMLLLAGIFVNRPYCRYLCPYGVLLNIFSRFSAKHLTITPAECTNCRLCEDACPYDAILPSDTSAATEESDRSRKRFLSYLILLPVFAVSGVLILQNISPYLAILNKEVRLAREIRKGNETGLESSSKAAVAFREAGKTEEQLFSEEAAIVERFRKASPWAGLFLGISFGIAMISFTIRNRREGYIPDKGKCYSCGRCFKFCPIKVIPDNEA